MFEDDYEDDEYWREDEEEDEWEGYCRTCSEREESCVCPRTERGAGHLHARGTPTRSCVSARGATS